MRRGRLASLTKHQADRQLMSQSIPASCCTQTHGIGTVSQLFSRKGAFMTNMLKLSYFRLTLALAFATGACDRPVQEGASTLAHHHHNNPTSEYKDMYQLVAAGCNCDDLNWMFQECAKAPGGVWGGGHIPGVCGEAVSSCYYAAEMRNQTLGCWSMDHSPACGQH